MNRYLAVVSDKRSGNIPPISFDFHATSMAGAGSRARITALRMMDEPENILIWGIRQIPEDTPDDQIEEIAKSIIEAYP